MCTFLCRSSTVERDGVTFKKSIADNFCSLLFLLYSFCFFKRPKNYTSDLWVQFLNFSGQMFEEKTGICKGLINCCSWSTSSAIFLWEPLRYFDFPLQMSSFSSLFELWAHFSFYWKSKQFLLQINGGSSSEIWKRRARFWQFFLLNKAVYSNRFPSKGSDGLWINNGTFPQLYPRIEFCVQEIPHSRC